MLPEAIKNRNNDEIAICFKIILRRNKFFFQNYNIISIYGQLFNRLLETTANLEIEWFLLIEFGSIDRMGNAQFQWPHW